MLTPVEFHQKIPARLVPERWRESLARREAEKARKSAHESALRLAEILIKYPHRVSLQEAPPMTLPDGRNVNVRLINTGEFESLDKLLQAQRGADRIEVYIGHEKDAQYGYSITWNIARQPEIGDYREYYQGNQIAAVFDSHIDGKTHAAYIEHTETYFDPTRQRDVYMRCKEIFDIAHTLLTAQQSSARLP